MPAAPIPFDEAARLAALRRYEVLDTPVEDAFDRFTRLASTILGTPIALISLIDESRQWFKSVVGLDARTTPREQAFCGYAILADEILEVADATADPRFEDNPLVTGAPGIRFYAGAPLATPDGHRIGTLCVIDREVRPHTLTPLQRQQLRDLAALVVDQLELRRRTRDLEESRLERERQMETLREREQQYRLLFRDNPQAMFAYDVDTLAMIDANPAAEALFGYGPGEMGGLTVLDIQLPTEFERTRAHVANVGDRVVTGLPWRNRRKDGSVVHVRSSSFPTLFDGRRARLVMAADISAEKQLEAQLVQSQKMEAVGQLAGGIAHDFNNLLTVINGYAQLLTARLHQADPLRADAAHILQAGERAAALTQQLLAFSRRQVLQPQPLDVRRVIDGLRPMLARVLRENIEVRTGVPPALPPAMVDPAQLEQVLMNLVLNASDAMPEGGTLSLEAGEATIDDTTATVLGMPAGRYVTIAVSDTGVGMDEATRSRIFEPFFTTKASTTRGSGLGLPVALGVIAQSGGHMIVDTAPGAGTTVTVYLPLPASEEAPEVRADASTTRGRGTVLIVEDHEAVRQLTADILRGHGYTVLTADHGADAIALVEARGGDIDLLITDVIMPRMSGREVAEALTALVPDLAVLFMSGYTQTAIVHKGVLETGLQFLPKPFTPDQLIQRVGDVLAARPGPVVTSGTTGAHPAVTPAQSPTPARPRIVVADDEPGLRNLLVTTLSSAGYEPLQAANGLEAVRLCESGRVDLLLTDLVMPDQEGLETIRRMRLERPAIPIVAMSGAFEGGFLEVARAMGAAAVIQKPFTPDQLVKVVARVLGEQDKASRPH